MEGDGKPAQPEAPMDSSADAAAASGDWRARLLPDARQTVANRTVETLQRHSPKYITEDLNELRKIAPCSEEEIYSAATSQPDYLRNISLISMVTKTQQTAPINPAMPNAGAVNQNHADPGLSSQNNMSGLHQQPQLLRPLSSISNMQPDQRAILLQKNAALQQQQQQQTQQSSLSLLQSQEIQQRIQGSGPFLHAQNAKEQKPFIQKERGLPEVSSSTSMESTDQTGVVDWQEECYQKVKCMKEQYFAEVTEYHHMVALRLQQQEALVPPGKQSEHHEKLRRFRTMLECMLAFLQINKNDFTVGMKEKLPLYEKQILNMVASARRMGTLQNSMSTPQQANMNTPSQSAASSLQSNVGQVQPSENVLQQQQFQLQQLQQMQQQLHHRYLQQRQPLMHQLRRRRLLQQQQPLQQQLQQQQPLQQQPLQQQLQQQQHLQQQLQQQQKQQQSSQLPGHQAHQPHSVNELNEPKARQVSGTKSGLCGHSAYNQQTKPGSSYPVSSPQNPQASSRLPEVASDHVPEKGSAEEPTASCRICLDGGKKRQEPTFSCPICMHALASPISTVCGHIFCEACIMAALKRRKECPVCRTKLRGRNTVHRVFLPTTD